MSQFTGFFAGFAGCGGADFGVDATTEGVGTATLVLEFAGAVFATLVGGAAATGAGVAAFELFRGRGAGLISASAFEPFCSRTNVTPPRIRITRPPTISHGVLDELFVAAIVTGCGAGLVGAADCWEY